MAVSTFFPDADPETTSVDGRVQESTGQEWADIRSDVGDTANDTNDNVGVAYSIQTVGPPVLWRAWSRGIFLFDTSSIPDSATIDSATFELVAISKTDNFTDSMSMVTSAPASNTALVAGDFDSLGTTKQASDITIASITADSSTFTAFTLNATGLSNISKTGVTKFGVRGTADNDNNEPTGTDDEKTEVIWASAEEQLSGDKRPKLVVTHTNPAAGTSLGIKMTGLGMI